MPAKSKKKRKNRKKKQRRFFYSRLFIFSALFVGVFLLLGSLYMRNRVASKLKSRAVSSASVVLSKAIGIYPGLSIASLKLESRLKRLNYKEVQRTPKRMGEYQKQKNFWRIFVRDHQLASGAMQRSELVELRINSEKLIDEIINKKYKQPIGVVYLQPEVISTLGSNAMRTSTFKKLDEFPEYLVSAIISTEDRRFYSHIGLDIRAILRAAWKNISAGKIVEGGSTLTQQLAKNLFLSRERSLARKAQEAVASLLIETAFSKDEILELYMNEIFLAQDGNIAIHGFAEASKTLFGKPVEHLSLAESATLAGMIKAPSSYSPRRHPNRAAGRRKLVLDLMAKEGFIDKDIRDLAKVEKISIAPAVATRRVAPYFVDHVRTVTADAMENIDNYKGLSLAVHTGMDPEIQKCADSAVKKSLKKLEKKIPRKTRKSKSPLQASLVALTPRSGEILAWVGGRDYGKSQFDRITKAKRQPGSLFKPFVYLTAIDKLLNNYRVARTTSLLEDEPLSLEVPGTGIWEPKNYSKDYLGEVTLRYALAKSLNVPTVNLAMKVGIEQVAQTAELLGIGKNLPRVPSLALGAVEVTPFQIARAYTSIASGGLLIDPKAVFSITDRELGEPLYEGNYKSKRVANSSSVYVLTNMLQSVVEHGTARRVRSMGFTRPTAGKTGTTNDARDSWFAGFTPQILAVVWVGFDDNSKVGLTGSSGALPVWTEFAKCAHQGSSVMEFEIPKGVVFKKIESKTGLLNHPDCPQEAVVTEVFVEGTEPVTSCLEVYGRAYDRFGSERVKPRWKDGRIDDLREKNGGRGDRRRGHRKRKGVLERLFGF